MFVDLFVMNLYVRVASTVAATPNYINANEHLPFQYEVYRNKNNGGMVVSIIISQFGEH